MSFWGLPQGERCFLAQAAASWRPLGGTEGGRHCGLEGIPSLHVEEIKAQGTLGDLILALVEVEPLDEFLLRKAVNQFNRRLHLTASPRLSLGDRGRNTPDQEKKLPTNGPKTQWLT